MDPLQVTFRHMHPSPALEKKVYEKVKKLQRHFSKLVSCQVVIEAPPHEHQGNLYHVRIHLGVPGEDIIINHHPGQNPAHIDAYVAVRDAFDAAERWLKKQIDEQRGWIKHHEEKEGSAT